MTSHGKTGAPSDSRSMADAKTETALVLPAEAAGGSTAPVHFPGFPGVFTPEQPIAVGALGFDKVTDARAAVDDTGVPLRETRVEAGSAPLPERENHVPSEAQTIAAEQSAAEEGDAPYEAPEGWPQTHAELDVIAEREGLEFPPGTRTVADKTMFLVDAEVSPEPDDEEGGA